MLSQNAPGLITLIKQNLLSFIYISRLPGIVWSQNMLKYANLIHAYFVFIFFGANFFFYQLLYYIQYIVVILKIKKIKK